MVVTVRVTTPSHLSLWQSTINHPPLSGPPSFRSLPLEGVRNTTQTSFAPSTVSLTVVFVVVREVIGSSMTPSCVGWGDEYGRCDVEHGLLHRMLPFLAHWQTRWRVSSLVAGEGIEECSFCCIAVSCYRGCLVCQFVCLLVLRI